ncbi:hypothetical protein [Lacticaseibacillus thailandensis]|uniref:Uncharacterized protein n=2 Tax=Lacticaseibacillus thailandensis TaxID=381741 RepID=A0A0R2C9P6_9LACO|nr:hypothetical protein [Lacticaseibacillus thailandensis]KRM88096.1 hypothetical protein FD19_GL000385 [Lacticaseibacillus thailandensis DSM 22698 = JCM 13996]
MEQAVLIDMDITLIASAERHVQGLEGHNAVLNAVLDATKNGLDGVDDLFHDGGMVREDIRAIATGFLRDATDLEGTALEDRVDEMVSGAVKYLHSHQGDFKNI